MNSLASCTAYSASPWLDFDLNHFGGLINFRSQSQIAHFTKALANLETNQGLACCSSLLKSHHPAAYFLASIQQGLRVAVILRHPAEVMLSYWRWLPSLPWHEADLWPSPLELLESQPAGGCLRYQLASHRSHFERWAAHAQGWLNLARSHPDRVAVTTYADLLEDHAAEMECLASTLLLDLITTPKIPDRHTNVVHGTNLLISEANWLNLVDQCEALMNNWPDLKTRLRLSAQGA
jgi:hypothetical protein